MLSIISILTIIVFFQLLVRWKKINFLKKAIVILVNVLLIECVFYGYFLLLIYQGNSFLLIGHQKILDNLIKTRLIYSIYFAQGKKYFINQVDDKLGYTIGRGKDTGLYQTNWDGIRSSKEYTLIPSQETLRVAAFGDSRTFCEGVNNENTWEYHLEHSSRNIEVMNFGVPGYTGGQPYLKYLKDGMKFNPDVIIFNKIPRNLQNNFKDFASTNNLRSADLYKVNFWLNKNVLLSKSISPYDLFDESFRKKIFASAFNSYERYSFLNSKIASFTNTGVFIKLLMFKRLFAEHQKGSSRSEEFDANLSYHLFQNLFMTAARNNTQIIFLSSKDVDVWPQNILKLFDEYKDVVYFIDLKKYLEKRYQAHGLCPSNGVCNTNELYFDSTHFNEKGNQIFAQAILDTLKDHSWGLGKRKFAYDAQTESFRRLK